VTNWVDVSVLVEITSLSANRLSEGVGSTGVRFDVNAKLEEKERRSGRVVVLFGLTVRTKPNVVKYDVEGSATLSGKDTLIDQMLKVDPKSNVPFVFHRIYQHVFTAIFTMASFLGTVYPPPDLLFSGKSGLTTGDLGKAQPVGVAQPPVPPK
jgi:hypothetical protein